MILQGAVSVAFGQVDHHATRNVAAATKGATKLFVGDQSQCLHASGFLFVLTKEQTRLICQCV